MIAKKVIAIGLGLYAIYLPAGWLIHRKHVPSPRPAGHPVEMLLTYQFDSPDHYVTRSHTFHTTNFPDSSHISVYENQTRLPTADFDFRSEDGGYFVRIRTSDGSDPRSNGRQYWLVGTGDD